MTRTQMDLLNHLNLCQEEQERLISQFHERDEDGIREDWDADSLLEFVSFGTPDDDEGNEEWVESALHLIDEVCAEFEEEE